MPWNETCPMDLRRKFIDDWKLRELSVVRLCEAYGISRKTGYKWIDRYEAEGMQALADRSRAPAHCPHAIEDELAAFLLGLRRKHCHWGPRKLLGWMKKFRPDLRRPASSSVGDLLKRNGLVAERTKRVRIPQQTQPFGDIAAPNDTWCTDFKGEFRVGSGEYCYPLTLTDAFSRYLLRCTGLTSTSTAGAIPVFRSAFEEYGLPRVIRSDNGVPFAAPGAASLARLSVWFIRLGIRPEWIAPASPQQNGRHERMHWTLKQETALPPSSTFAAQQRAFDAFRQEFNHERPHEALGQETPAAVFERSPRRLPRVVPEFAYPTSFAARCVKTKGEISWNGTRVFVSGALVHEVVGLREREDGTWDLFVGPMRFGLMSEQGSFRRLRRPVWEKTEENPT